MILYAAYKQNKEPQLSGISKKNFRKKNQFTALSEDVKEKLYKNINIRNSL